MKPYALIIPAHREFARQLRAARLHAGLTQGRLAELAAMSRHGYRKIERYAGGVQLSTIVLLANALGCEIADFFPRTKQNPWS